jgi:hypothetical protein
MGAKAPENPSKWLKPKEKLQMVFQNQSEFFCPWVLQSQRRNPEGTPFWQFDFSIPPWKPPLSLSFFF